MKKEIKLHFKKHIYRLLLGVIMIVGMCTYASLISRILMLSPPKDFFRTSFIWIGDIFANILIRIFGIKISLNISGILYLGAGTLLLCSFERMEKRLFKSIRAMIEEVESEEENE